MWFPRRRTQAQRPELAVAVAFVAGYSAVEAFLGAGEGFESVRACRRGSEALSLEDTHVAIVAEAEAGAEEARCLAVGNAGAAAVGQEEKRAAAQSVVAAVASAPEAAHSVAAGHQVVGDNVVPAVAQGERRAEEGTIDRLVEARSTVAGPAVGLPRISMLLDKLNAMLANRIHSSLAALRLNSQH